MRATSVIFAALALIALIACGPQPVREFDQADRGNIDRFIEEFVALYNAKDSIKVAQAFADNGAVMPPNASTVRGTENVRIYYDERFRQGASDLKLETLDVVGEGSLAYAAGNYWLNMAPEGGEVRRDRGKFIFVLREFGDNWRLDRLMFSSDFAPEAGD